MISTPAQTPFELSVTFRSPVRRALFSLVKRPLEDLLGLRELDRLYERYVKNVDAADFPDAVLDVLGVRVEVSSEYLEHIPRDGPLVVVANHPFGAVEGLVLLQLLRKVRPDTKLLGNFLLQRVPQMHGAVIFVDPFGRTQSTRVNVAPLRESVAWLRNGGVLGIFPAGVVSHLHLKRRRVCDPSWSDTVARLIRLTGVPVLPVFFAGRNGPGFQAAGLIHPRLRTALLPRAFLQARGKTVEARIGQAILFAKVDSFASDADALAYLRMRTYMLSSDDRRRRTHRLAAIRQRAAHYDPVLSPADPAILAAEVAALPEEQYLVGSGDFEVRWADAQQIPQVLREIGRLRELSFRAVGQGTGKAIDLDRFDNHYLHLFVWNKNTRQVVGAYRLGPTDRILPQYGSKGLYTRAYYRFADRLLVRINPALELGRSFVRAEYQKQHSPMALLWKGIGTFVARNPKYNTLFGVVSISNDYQSVSRQMMIAFLEAHAFLPDLAKLAKPRNPARLQLRDEVQGARRLVTHIDEVSELIAGIEQDQKGVPVLLRQYLRLNAKFLSCNVVPGFSDAWFGLMLADLTEAEPRILERHLGKTGAAQFLDYHRKRGRLAG